MSVIGEVLEFGGFSGKVIYIHGDVEKFGILLENNTVDFVRGACTGKEYLDWLREELK